MSDYYVGMKHETFLTGNKDNIRHTDRVFNYEGGNVSQYQWNDGRIILILWHSRPNQLRIAYIEK